MGYKWRQLSRGGILEDTFWSLWPWPRSLKSSKIGLSSARGQHYFLNRWNFVGRRQKSREKFAKTFFVFLKWRLSEKKFLKTFFAWKKFLRPFLFRDCLKKIFEDLCVCFFLQNTCACVLGPWPWPREGLSLASKFFCVRNLGPQPCVLDSTTVAGNVEIQ